jgi:hypothetical protein
MCTEGAKWQNETLEEEVKRNWGKNYTKGKRREEFRERQRKQEKSILYRQ